MLLWKSIYSQVFGQYKLALVGELEGPITEPERKGVDLGKVGEEKGTINTCQKVSFNKEQ